MSEITKMVVSQTYLISLSDFESLQKGDCLCILWDKTTRNGKNEEVQSPMISKIKEIKIEQYEIILDEPHNLYFNYNMYLHPKTQGMSRCKTVTKLNIYKLGE